MTFEDTLELNHGIIVKMRVRIRVRGREELEKWRESVCGGNETKNKGAHKIAERKEKHE